MQDTWNATDSYSTWTNNGSGSFVGGNVAGGISHENFTNFYNFLAGGGTGSYTYWTNSAAQPNSGYAYDGHHINIKSNDNGWLDNFTNYVGDHLYMNSDLYMDFGPQFEIKGKFGGVPIGFNLEGKDTEKMGFKFNIENNKIDSDLLRAERGENNTGFGIGIYGYDTTFTNSGRVLENTHTIGPIGFKFNYETGEKSVVWTVLDGKASLFLGLGGQLSFGWKY